MGQLEAAAAPPAPPDEEAGPERPPEAEHGHQHAVEDEHESLTGALRQRSLALLRASRGIRLYSGAAVVFLLVCTVLALFTDLPWPRMDVSPGNGHLLTIPVPVFVLALGLFAIAWSYLLVGAAYSRWPVHLLGLVAFSGVFGVLISALALVPLFLGLATLVLLLIWVAGFAGRLRHGRHRERLSARLFVAHVGLLLLLYAIVIAGSLRSGSLLLFSTTLAIQLEILQLVAIPVLVMAGTDFTEWGEVAADWLAERARGLGKRRVWLPAAVAAVLAAAVLADTSRQYGSLLGPQLVFGLLALALLAALARAARVTHHARPVRVPVGAVIVASLVFVLVTVAVAIAGGAVRVTAGDTVNGLSFSHYAHPQAPTFSIQQPSLWDVRTLTAAGGRGVRFSGAAAGNQATFDVLAFPSGALDDVPAPEWAGAGLAAGPATADGAWTERELTGGERWGLAWTRDEGGQTWLLVALTRSSLRVVNEPTFRHMAQTWSPDASAPAPAGGGGASVDFINGVSGLVWLALAGLLALTLALRRRMQASLAVSALYLAICAVLLAVFSLGAVASVLHLPDRVLGLKLTGLRLQGVQALTSLLTLLAVGWFAVRRRLGEGTPLLLLLAGLLIGLQAVSWMFEVFGQKQGSLGLVQVALISLALAWDVVMSGGSMVSGHGRWFPRHSRALLYFGFSMLVASSVLFFAAQRDQVTGGPASGDFNTDFWPQSGLITLGIPMLLCFALLKLGRLRARR